MAVWRQTPRRGRGRAGVAPVVDRAIRLRHAWPRFGTWRDPLLLIGLFALAVQSRRPFKMVFPYGWDSLLYLRALDHFNATVHRPQPPGYLFYVSTARAIELVLGDPHRALVWLSILASAVAVTALYLVGRLLFDWVTGLIAAGLLLTSVTFWFYSEIAYPYTTLAAGSTILALLALAVRRGLLPGTRGAALAAGAFGLLAGFRQDLLLFLAPLFVVALWGRPLRQWLAAGAAGAAGILCWLLPTAALSEGLSAYLGALLHQGSAASGESSAFTVGLTGLRANAREVGIFLWRGLYFALLPLAYLLLRGIVRRPRRPVPAFGWVLLWLVPPLLFYLLAHIGDYGYTFSVLPPLLILAARGTVLAGRDLARAIAASRARRQALRAAFAWATPSYRAASIALALLLGLAITVADARIFLAPEGQFSVGGIGCFDATMRARIELVRARFNPAETLVFSSGYYRHVRYFLPEYRAWLYAPTDGARVERAIAPGTRYLLVFDEVARPARSSAAGFDVVTLPCNGAPFYYTAVRGGDIIRFDARAITVAVHRRP